MNAEENSEPNVYSQYKYVNGVNIFNIGRSKMAI